MIEAILMTAPARLRVLFVAACLPLLGAGAAGAAPLLTVVSTGTPDARDLALRLTGCGITVTEAAVAGSLGQFGVFTTTATGVLGFDAGLIMSTGNITAISGTNLSEGSSTAVGSPGDPDLTALAVQTTYDAAVLEFDFIPSGTVVSFDFVFGSEEYNEYVGSFNDVFAFWLDGVNLAVVPSTTTPISINTVNLTTNSAYYRNNDLASGTGLDVALDGVTTVVTVSVPILPDVRHHIKFAIADAGDAAYDSVVFIRSGSFASLCPPVGTSTTFVQAVPTEPLLRAVPNPFRPGSGGAQDAPGIALLDVPAGGTVRIYTLAGARVVELRDEDGDGIVLWDAKIGDGSPAASGLYLAVAEGGGVRRRTRLVVAR